MAPRKGNELGSWELPGEKKAGETKVRRSYCVKELVTQPLAGLDTTYDVVQYAARTRPNKQAFGTRTITDIVTETKEVTKMVDGVAKKEQKEWKYFQLSEYKWITYKQFAEKVGLLGTGLWELGLGKRNESEASMLTIYGQTSLHWQLMAQSCGSISVPISTCYDTLGVAGLKHALQETESPAMFTNAELLPTLVQVLGDCPKLNSIIYDGEPKGDIVAKLQAVREGVKLITIAELEALGRNQSEIKVVPPKRDDTCCVMYTSGSTGTPKGVILTHGNLISSAGAVYHLLYEIFNEQDVYLAYLPLAHILELVVEVSWMFVGMPIGYGRVKTLTDASVRNCRGDIAELRPTIMTGVPAVWETIRKGVNLKVSSAGAVTRGVFKLAYNSKLAARKYGLPGVASLADAVVFNKVKAQTGGRLRYVLSGGAALSRSTQEFLSTALVTTLQGYGLTETVGMCCILPPDFWSLGPSGVPVPSMEVKLVDVPDAGYLSTNRLPQGEILCRGPSLFKGYFRRPDLDAEAFAEGGWFRTGDVGQFNADGTMSIIDRIKNLVKLAGGEYIALEKLESVYKSAPLVGNLCVLANPDFKQPIAVMVPHEANFAKWAKEQGFTSETGGDLSHLASDRKAKAAILAQINATGKQAGLAPMESLGALVLTFDEWTPESGMVTAAQKIQRKNIERAYEEEIKKVTA